MVFPSAVKKSDTIGIVCPAGFMAAEKATTCIETLKQWGFQVKVGKTLGLQSNYFAGTDAQRLEDLQEMLDDKNVKAILCGRGGYGTSRIIDQINWKTFKKNPKWIIGYSDITVLHSFLFTKLKTASIHSPMAAAFNDDGWKNEYIQSLHDILVGKKNKYTVEANDLNRKGVAKGQLIGGNLTMIAHQIGTPSDINTKGKILFIEDVGEYIYNIDRIMVQLQRSGKLETLAGLIVGGMTDMKDTTVPFGEAIEEAIFDKVKQYAYPVCFHFPVSHDIPNYALKIGAEYDLKVGKNVILKEL